jgi:hypothetical protein
MEGGKWDGEVRGIGVVYAPRGATRGIGCTDCTVQSGGTVLYCTVHTLQDRIESRRNSVLINIHRINNDSQAYIIGLSFPSSICPRNCA